ncbi:DUF7010 family protein [Dictyobacter aurantiacus]|uniref:Uncharacterized protein n=1 Tax=Dictyobacter aurantiacus TaxID=1936993 RepID=A0A401ZMW7_9CHLR|nr:hypothetical protein [Dictyobacter aurantiacus]GCE08202.1 hypothetical protein KDAU_55310 [Dictyobacter aurantiacus]
MVQPLTTVPASAVRGVSSGVIFMAFFSTLWADIGVGGLQGWGGIWPVVAIVLIGVGLFVGAISLLVASRGLPDQAAGMGGDQNRKRTNMWFIIVFATEIILIFLASYICNALLHRLDLFFPVMALIVGAHFFPLAPLFRIKMYHVVGAVLCLLGLLTLFVIPLHMQIDGLQINAQQFVLGFGAALVLWCVGIGLWLLGRRWLALSSTSVSL